MEQGGVESVVCDLNRVAAGAGWRSVVMSKGGRLAERIEADGGRHVAIDLKSKNPFAYFARALQLRRRLRELAAEDSRILVCAHSRVPAWLFVWANRALGLKWITYAHGANSVSRYSEVMTRGDLVVAPSKFLAGYLLDNYGSRNMTLAERLRVVSPCVDMARFDPSRVDAAEVARLRREWGIEPGMFVTMSVGRISPVKGFANTLRDFATSVNSHGKLIIVGGVDKRHKGHLEELRALAKSLGIEDRVVFAGAQSKIPECLSIADEVVVGNMSKPESFGLSVVEALAMDKPVRLLREFGGAAEILANVAGLTAGRREAVRSLYGFEVMAAKTVEAYEKLV